MTEEEQRDGLDPRIPKSWEVPRSEARVGRFAVVEMEWDRDEVKGEGQDLKGIALYRVPLLFAVFVWLWVYYSCLFFR